MRKNLFWFLVFISNFSFSHAQLVKTWDSRFGGSIEDNIFCLEQTRDGGYILGGNSASGVGGDKTQPNWDTCQQSFDYWIVKIDSLGNLQWDKRYGGMQNEFLNSVQQTPDRGYLLGGHSNSGMTGDKTQDTWGGYDFWIVKIDSLGNIQWDKRYGGTSDDYFGCLRQIADGGYILGGYSYSGISGNRTEPCWGGEDYWILKIDSLGNVQWDKRYGGINDDHLTSILQTTSGNFIIGGYSVSGISGDKTEPSWGDSDYWILKIDSLGVLLWDKRFGGINEDRLYGILASVDGEYILGGYTYSDISGDKSQPSWGAIDYWIIKTDSLGNLVWDKRFGGTANDWMLSNLSSTITGGYLMAGTSSSPLSGDKTEANLGYEQTWVVNLDSLGNKIWDKTIFTTGYHDRFGLALQSSCKCFVMANSTIADTGGYKTQVGRGSNDYWIVKFCMPSTQFISDDPLLCEKFCTNFYDQSTNNPTSWLWQFPGGTPASSTDQNPTNICYNEPGVYDVTLITTNANGSDTLTLHDYITVYPTPPIPIITQNGYALTSSQADFYQWQLNTVDIPGATNQSYEVLQTGFYTVIVSDTNSCVNSTTLYVEITGIDEVSDEGISVYPNPSDGIFTISFGNTIPASEVTLQVTDAIGRSVYFHTTEQELQPPILQMDLHQLPRGVYFLTIRSLGFPVMKKIIIG